MYTHLYLIIVNYFIIIKYILIFGIYVLEVTNTVKQLIQIENKYIFEHTHIYIIIKIIY